MAAAATTTKTTMKNHNNTIPSDPVYHPTGPLELIYGPESPIKLTEVTRHISSAKKRRRPIRHLSFLGCTFYGNGSTTKTAFRSLGRRLRGRVGNDVQELAINGVSDVGNEELCELAPFLNSNVTLRSLDLTGGTFGNKAIREIRRFFRRNSSLEVLVLGENECVGDEGVETIMESFHAGRKRGSLRVLAVESCGVGHRGASSISAFMSQGGGSSLRVLEMSNNAIGDLGAETLAQTIQSGHRLGHLGLNNTGIGDDGVKAFAKALKYNRSLHRLSLQNNTGITDVWASSMLKLIYNTDSIKTIIGSNHTLKDLVLRGCNAVDPKLLQLANQLSARSRLLITKDAVLRFKVSTYLKTSKCGLALDDYDLELMPHILAFVGKSNGGITSLFHTLKSMPLLYTQYDPQGKNFNHEDDEAEAETKKEGEEESANNTTDFLEQFKLSARRARKYYAIFVNRIPKRSSMLRCQDGRIRNKHESSVSTANNNEHYLSSNNNNSNGNVTSNYFVSLNVLKKALLLWLFHARFTLMHTTATLVPFKNLIFQVFGFVFFCPQAQHLECPYWVKC